MDKVKEFQGSLMRYFVFGNTEEVAKEKVKSLAEDLKFLGLPIRDNIDKIQNDNASFHILLTYSDMGFIKEIRNHIEAINLAEKELQGHPEIDKKAFSAQYVTYLKGEFGSESLAVAKLKTLGSNMKDLGCPLGENLKGYTHESVRLKKLMAFSSMNIINSILKCVDNIKK